MKYRDVREKYNKRVLALRAEPPVVFLSEDWGGGGGGGVLMRIRGERVPPVLQILTLFQTKKMSFFIRVFLSGL